MIAEQVEQGSDSVHAKKQELKSFRFSPVVVSDIHFIPTRNELSPAEKRSTWYQTEEVNKFKSNARLISRILRSQKQQTPSDHGIGTELNNNSVNIRMKRKKPTAEYRLRVMGQGQQVNNRKSSRTARTGKVEQSDLFVRGLERLVYLERKAKKHTIIQFILRQQEQNRDDSIGLGFVARKCTSPAKAEALKTGKADAEIAAGENQRSSQVVSSDINNTNEKDVQHSVIDLNTQVEDLVSSESAVGINVSVRRKKLKICVQESDPVYLLDLSTDGTIYNKSHLMNTKQASSALSSVCKTYKKGRVLQPSISVTC